MRNAVLSQLRTKSRAYTNHHFGAYLDDILNQQKHLKLIEKTKTFLKNELDKVACFPLVNASNHKMQMSQKLQDVMHTSDDKGARRALSAPREMKESRRINRQQQCKLPTA